MTCYQIAFARSASLLLFSTACLIATASHAQLFFDFIEDGTDDALARLELSALPATHLEIAGLAFTPAGDDLFGYGPTYPGDFDVTSGEASDDGADGLQGFGIINDIDPPLPSLPSAIQPQRFGLEFNNPTDTTERDRIILAGEDGNLNFLEIVASGRWQAVAVPEPTTAVLGALATGAWLVRRRRPG